MKRSSCRRAYPLRKGRRYRRVWLCLIRLFVGVANLAGFLSPRALLAHESDPSLMIRIRVYNYSQASQGALAGAERGAERVFREARLDIQWLNCPIGSDAAVRENPCAELLNENELVVRVLAEPPPGVFQEDVFGVAVLPILASVYYEPARRRARSDDAEFEAPIILGCAIAHEVGHLLLGPNGHSTVGIMRPRWERGDIRQAIWRCLLFTAEQARAMRGAARARARTVRAKANDHVERQTELPFELYNEHLIVVKGDVGPIKDVPILLDTGRNPTAISAEIAGQLNLRGTTEPLLSSTGRIDVMRVMLPSIDIGALHGRSVRVVVQDLNFMRRSLGISIGAVAGLDILSTGSFMIDYWKRKLVFASGGAGRKSVRFETERPFLTVKAKIRGQELRLLVDSGTPRLLLFRKRLETNVNLEPLANDRNTVIFTSAGRVRANWFSASDIWLGTQNIGPQLILVADGDPDSRLEFDGLLGLAKTGFQRIWFDFENALLGWS